MRHTVIPGRTQLAPLTQHILATLKDGPQFGSTLAALSPSFSNHLQFLRNAGHAIDSQPAGNGEYIYRFYADVTMPLWDVDVCVTLADGTLSVQQLRVEAMTIRHAKAKARSHAAYTKAGYAVLRTAPVTGNEMKAATEGH